MTALLAIGLIGGGLLGLGGGVSKSKQREAEYQDKLQELNRQKEVLDTQFSQAKDSYNLASTQARERTEETNTELALLGKETLENRDLALGQTGKSGAMQSEINAMQLATLAIQNQMQVGQATQQAATSGFRGSASAMNQVTNAQLATEMATEQARMQSKLSNYQTYASAVRTYTSATQQAEAYNRQIDQNKNELDRQLVSLDLQMNQQKERYELEGGYLSSDIEYMKTEGRKALRSAQTWDILGGTLSGALSGGAMFA